MYKSNVIIKLKHPSTNHTIVINAPAKIEVGIFRPVFLPFSVKPFDKSGLIITIILAILILITANFVCNRYTGSINILPLFICLQLVLYLFYRRKTYFKYYIINKIRKGYRVKNQDHLDLLLDSGTIFLYSIDQGFVVWNNVITWPLEVPGLHNNVILYDKRDDRGKNHYLQLLILLVYPYTQTPHRVRRGTL